MTLLTLKGLKHVVVSSRKDIPESIAKWLGIEQVRFVPKETDFIKNIGTAFKGIEIISQYSVDQYRLDAYMPLYNIAIEFDERHHLNQQAEDEMREEYIKDKLGCVFVRAKPTDNIFEIIHILVQLIYAPPRERDSNTINQ